MPALAAAMGDDLDAMVDYVRSMADGIDAGSPIHTKYVTFCGACHAADGTGNKMLGGPNLTDDIWLVRQLRSAVRQDHRRGPQWRDAGT